MPAPTSALDASLRLQSGSRVAVIGSGPAGSFFAFFALQLARQIGSELRVDLFDGKDFRRRGPTGCNHCGGILSESLVQILATEGIEIPAAVVYRGIDSYVLHTATGSVRLETPLQEMRIAAVHRGAGPMGRAVNEISGSFDGFLQELAIRKGARFVPEKVEQVRLTPHSAEVKTSGGDVERYDLVVGAVGLNPHSLKMFSGLGTGYAPPKTARTAICEFYLGRDRIEQCLGDSMHTFLLDLPGLKFAAVIPKGEYATAVLLGRGIGRDLLNSLFQREEFQRCFPSDFDFSRRPDCQCYPEINVAPARCPYADRLVLVGDCGVSKLYKNGIGAAYITAKAAASTAVMQGVSWKDFHRHYAPVCRRMARDNHAGRLLFAFTGLIQRSRFLQRSVVRTVLREQSLPGRRRLMSRVLWDAFTGSAPYFGILGRAMLPRFLWNFACGLLAAIRFRGVRPMVGVFSRRGEALGKRYGDGEVIVRQGEFGESLYVILSGSVEVTQSGARGESRLADLHAGDFFGEMSLFTRARRAATVRAHGEVRVLTVDKSTLLRTIQENPSLAFRLLQALSARIQHMDTQFGGLTEIVSDSGRFDPSPHQAKPRPSGHP